jgi:hypothetical protein
MGCLILPGNLSTLADKDRNRHEIIFVYRKILKGIYPSWKADPEKFYKVPLGARNKWSHFFVKTKHEYFQQFLSCGTKLVTLCYPLKGFYDARSSGRSSDYVGDTLLPPSSPSQSAWRDKIPRKSVFNSNEIDGWHFCACYKELLLHNS